MSGVVIVGGGLFGSIVAATLRRDGHTVTVIDAQKEGAGSKPAACLMKPSWFSSMGRDKYEPSLQLLDELYGVKDVAFKAGGLLNATVHWVDPAKILVPSLGDIEGEVLAVTPDGEGFRVVLKSGVVLLASTVIVSAGIWTNDLVKVDGLVGRAGVAFRWKNLQLAQPFISPWAPYRQTVGFNISENSVWVGDGSAIKPGNWTVQREDTSYSRCATAIGRAGRGDRENGRCAPLYGIRPYVPDSKPCYLREELPGLWVNTGGAKNGTISAGWAASVIREALK